MGLNLELAGLVGVARVAAPSRAPARSALGEVPPCATLASLSGSFLSSVASYSPLSTLLRFSTYTRLLHSALKDFTLIHQVTSKREYSRALEYFLLVSPLFSLRYYNVTQILRP